MSPSSHIFCAVIPYQTNLISTHAHVSQPCSKVEEGLKQIVSTYGDRLILFSLGYAMLDKELVEFVVLASALSLKNRPS